MLAILNGHGYYADVVGNGFEAVQAVRSVPYDLILMDVQMPVMDGLEAIGQIRRLNTGLADIPIIGVTAHALQGDRDVFLAAGMDDCLSKPIDKEELLRRIEFWLSRRKSIEQPPRQARPANSS